ncbi:Asp-tRNA(Asn)/Glu-tRNA(Gln) amidotransferase subunit GatB [Raineyella sp.]|uniref:Asp-tRNA(Asn)/Glu-tRNA(Gln) amidotransferase subunit GatB n=1 Tax=Raineyella sp. TaxID=1911550 RepID=UPI002B1F0280|nr:Asp-tRNA(Asn)/Glu-tRNA(Gln) amidotransferase subunit GatB [Raineyella sp.]MEA5154523.1 Asp-tRNA(Asn)/Glu-tRNA(Gln) amidotransferase subunit GatB [Raineyella sp.]
MSEPILSYADALDAYEPVMGLEVHVELNTASKMFCGCSTVFGAAPNTHTCPVCLGLPGAMPSINAKAVESAIRMGLALNCSIAEWCRMSRKNYFYPDMTKDYQISQYDEPIAYDGHLDVELDDGEIFRVPIERAHMEEDAGKLTHLGGETGRLHGAEYSLIDYNRAGVPLIEIVTKPIIGAGARAPEVARRYVETIRDLMRALGVSDVRMNEGSLRCDANVSLRPWGREKLGTRTETKNINSLRSIEGAVTYEIQRQAAVLQDGGTIEQCTRNWLEHLGETSFGRSKEEAEDYRYFPEPDLVPIAPSREWVEELRATLPEHPTKRRNRLQAAWGFSDLEMRDVVNADALDLIEQTVAAGATAQSARKWWTTELARRANEAGTTLEEVGVTPAQVAAVQALVDAGTINDKLARQVYDGVIAGEGEPEQVVARRGLAVVSDDGALGAAVDKAIAAAPDVAEKIRGGRVQAAGALIGAVMKEMRGQADAARVREIILEKLA